MPRPCQVYTARRPFDMQRLYTLLEQWPRDAASPLSSVSLELGDGAADAMSGARPAACKRHETAT